MYVKSLELTGFRNYTNQKIMFSRETNIFYGNNAQGKTNLLEAIFMFSSGKSFRRVSDRNLINYESDFARLKIEFVSFGVEKTAEIIISKEKNKFIKLNGVNLRKTSELLGNFNCVIFSPEEMFLINGAPELRRNFLDFFLSSQKPLYYNTLKRYYKALKQKNTLLKNIDEKNTNTLNVWNEELAEAGAKIAVYRKNTVKDISDEANIIYKKIAGDKEDFKTVYVPNVGTDDLKENEIKSKMLETSERKKQSEIAAGTCLTGIHRDDLEFYIQGKNAKSFSSQGQQRSAVIALKTAQAEIIKKECGEYPVFLLDDVMSELDSKRRSYIAKEIKNNQVIITCTDRNITKQENQKFFHVENGKVKEET